MKLTDEEQKQRERSEDAHLKAAIRQDVLAKLKGYEFFTEPVVLRDRDHSQSHVSFTCSMRDEVARKLVTRG